MNDTDVSVNTLVPRAQSKLTGKMCNCVGRYTVRWFTWDQLWISAGFGVILTLLRKVHCRKVEEGSARTTRIHLCEETHVMISAARSSVEEKRQNFGTHAGELGKRSSRPLYAAIAEPAMRRPGRPKSLTSIAVCFGGSSGPCGV